jgi:transposase-like protein
VLAGLGSPALLCPPSPQPAGQAAPLDRGRAVGPRNDAAPEREHERVRRAYWQALDEAINERDATQRLQALVDELDKAGYTAAARCLADDLDALVVHLRDPTRHRRRWRSTNLLERSLGEVKRRTKVIGRFPGETSCLTLVWAVLDPYIAHATNGIRFTQLARQHLKRTRYEGHEQAIPEEVTAA